MQVMASNADALERKKAAAAERVAEDHAIAAYLKDKAAREQARHHLRSTLPPKPAFAMFLPSKAHALNPFLHAPRLWTYATTGLQGPAGAAGADGKVAQSRKAAR